MLTFTGYFVSYSIINYYCNNLTVKKGIKKGIKK